MKDHQLKKVLIIGSGPIVIGQACEFDYSGTQACKALMKENLEVILVNSNPATIMTDPDIATRVYIEPLKASFLEKIIDQERPDALIPTLGGQTALNLALELHERGVLNKFNVRLLGADPKVIRAAEDREIFRSILDKVGAKYPPSTMVRTFEEGLRLTENTSFPLIIRPNYTLGGGGGGVAYSLEEYEKMLIQGLKESPTSEVLVEMSILGWKEFELEVMRDHTGTFVVVCSIENFDPCGVHTGDSITMAPQQTLSDREYQAMRDEAYLILNEVGVQTGGANIQFAVHPETGERVVIEMNPRVSRSSALASKATGFPIAKIAALLAIGYSLEEITNDITKSTPSCYEPALDYVVTKIPRFAFEKFSGVKDILTTQMKSVGEVMGIGRTLQESIMKAILSLEKNKEGFPVIEYRIDKITYPNSQRIYHIYQALRDGVSVEEMVLWTQISPYFIEQIQELVIFEKKLQSLTSLDELTPNLMLQAKRKGFSDALIARCTRKTPKEIEDLREKFQLHPTYLQIDTCAGEFASKTPYLYSTYWGSDYWGSDSSPSNHKPERSEVFHFRSPIAVIGSGPNRIGQGIEFDYSCVRAVKALKKWGQQVVMINSNPETVSTDYDTADVLFFEPLTAESVHEILRFANGKGFIAQVGGQTPIHLASHLVQKGHVLLGSDLHSIDLAEDRRRFSEICSELKLEIPKSGMASNIQDALNLSHQIGYPLIARPSYVLGGRRMEVIENEEELHLYFQNHGLYISNEKPCLIDQFLEGALEVDVDLVRGVDWLIVGGVLEHIEAAGVHSGDSMGVLPPQRLKPHVLERVENMSKDLAHRLLVLGHLNLQLAIQQDKVFVLEANPRSSRSVPFISKSTQIPIIDLGIAAMLGLKMADLPAKFPQYFSGDGRGKEKKRDSSAPMSTGMQDPFPRPGSAWDWHCTPFVSVKGVVFPFKKFPEADSILGPEMKSTGESMGRAVQYSEALMKAILSSQSQFPHEGEVFFSLRDKDKESLLPLAKELLEMNYTLSATGGTAKFFESMGLNVQALRKVHEGRPNCVDHIRQGKVAFVINTTRGRTSIEASFNIRRACTDFGIPCITESDAAHAFVLALKTAKLGKIKVLSL